MKKQKFLDVIASEDELTTSPKQMKHLSVLSWTQVHEPVQPETTILSLKKRPKLVEGNIGINRCDLSPIKKGKKYVVKNYLEAS